MGPEKTFGAAGFGKLWLDSLLRVMAIPGGRKMEPDETINRYFTKAFSSRRAFDRLYLLLRDYPDAAKLWFAVGEASVFLHGFSNRHTLAARCFHVCLQIDPGFVAAHDRLGDWYYYLQRYFQAESQYRQAIEYGGGDMSRYCLSVVYATTGRLDDAFDQLDRCVDQTAEHIRDARLKFANGFFLHPGYLPILRSTTIAHNVGKIG